MLRESAGTHPHLEQKEQPTIEQRKPNECQQQTCWTKQNHAILNGLVIKKMFYITLKCSNT